ncbi:MAG TPA: metallophosphoesterase [Actinomycetota bacterium]|nr:metallophosphoesterase [Actinomycetota bacterium]
MAVKVVSDLHSGVEALAREVGPWDTLLLLGDLINVIDYRAMDGILVEVYGAEAVAEVVQLRAQRRFDEARAVMRRRREGREEEVTAAFQGRIREGYRRVAQVLPARTLLILGNVDSPAIAAEELGSCAEFVDGKVVEIEGLRVGFAGGGLPTPLGVAGEVSEEDFDAKLAALGEVDIVCSHVPPDLPELTYDTIARRRERGSAGLLAYVREVQPQRVFFGHIHQPLLSSTHVGRTHLVNAGYFRKTHRALRLSL